MEDRETLQIQKYGEIETTQMMMATLRHVNSSSEFKKFSLLYFCLTEGIWNI